MYITKLKSKGKPEKLYIGITESPWKQKLFIHSIAKKKTCKQQNLLKACIETQKQKRKCTKNNIENIKNNICLLKHLRTL